MALFLLAAWLVGSRQSAPVNQPVADAAAPAIDVMLRADDGLSIAGTYWPGSSERAPAVLLLHGNDASREAMRPVGEWLAGQGYAALAIDFRGHGESARVERSFGYYEARDAHAAFRWLKARQGDAKVGIIGSSLGGAASLIGENGPVPADALVLQAVYPDIRRAIRNRIAARLGHWAAVMMEPALSYQSRLRIGLWPHRLAPINALPEYQGPVLLIGSEDDSYTPPAETRALARAAGTRAELWLVAGVDHAALVAGSDAAWRDRVGLFLARTLPMVSAGQATIR
jgi:alpha-beta hydrolase superfamily lysophospholipase